MCRRTSSETAPAPSVSQILACATKLGPILRRVRLRHFAESKATRRRVRILVLEVARACPQLLDAPPLGTFTILADLPWLREPSTWQGGGLEGLIRHLLVADRTPVPASLLFYPPHDARTPWRSRGSYTRQLHVLATLGRGGGLKALHRAGLLPRTVRRPVFRRLLSTPWTGAFDDHVRACQLLEHGVDQRLVREWVTRSGLRRFTTPTAEHAKDRVMSWLARARPARGWSIGQARDLLNAVQRCLAAGEDPTRVDPGRLLEREAQRQARIRARSAPVGPLPVLGLPHWTLVTGNAEWSVDELTTGEALAEEGRAMQHCVAGYVGKVRDGHCSIFSLSRAGQRCLTIELRLRDRRVVQVRGRRNRSPTPDEVAVLVQWTRARALTLGGR